MPRLDPRAYEEAVVKPLRRWSGRDLPDDLLGRYAVTAEMSDAQLADRLAEVRAVWNKGATSTGKAQSLRVIYKAFVAADAELRAREGARLETAAWWREFAARRAGSRQGEIDDLTRTLRSTFGTLGLVTAGQLEATLRAIATALAPAEVDRALAAAGVRREEPVELPASSGLQDTVYRTLRTRLAEARVGGVVELVHGVTSGFRLLREFRAPGADGGLTAAAVTSAVDRANRQSGNQPHREALGILSSAARAGADLRELALFHLLDPIRQNHAQGVPEGALLRQLRASGLVEEEARLVVFSVRNEATRVGRGGLVEITELLADGRLVAARQLLAGLSSTEDSAAAGELVRQHEERVAAALHAAREAVRSGSESAARQRFRQAAALAVDDEDIAAELRRVPPAPVLEVNAAPEGLGVRVSWRAPAEHPEDAVYRVVRKLGRPPDDPADGTAVYETTAHGTTAHEDTGGAVVVDRDAPAGGEVGYAVFARVDGGAWSRPASRVLVPCPPVVDVRVTHEDGEVSAHWSAHPDAIEVGVTRRAPGRRVRVAVAGRTAFREQVGPDEQEYSIVARYRRTDGALVESPVVSVRSAQRPRAAPVTDLEVAAVGESRVSIGWSGPAAADVTVRRASVPVPWHPGEVVSAAEAAGHGDEVRGDLVDDGKRRTLRADVPTGLFHYTAFTRGPDGLLCGREVVFGTASPVTGLAERRLGDEHVLTWVWPDGAGSAEVSWPGSTTRVTRQRYRAEGGFRGRFGPGQVVVRVVGLVAGSGGECRSAPTEITIGDRVPAVSYRVRMTRKPIVGGGQVRVEFVAAEPVECTVVLVVAAGRVLPLRAEQGSELARWTVRSVPGAPVEHVAELPRLRKPYWVRCFLTEGGTVRLVDPPTTQLKVS
ncbi:hypothetical protein [Actinokineospora enzanensis]|uniref:hypothetical protein n=1 Tax=Actinokineospora enzanensis TaxID=155975 RepID=UPI00036A9E9F|nr:hypothetical protein [Actinokineospora enzanensis]